MPDEPIRVRRSPDFASYVPSGFRSGVILSDPIRQIAVMCVSEDQEYSALQAAPVSVVVEDARLVLRPDHALTLLRMVAKGLNHIIDHAPDQARLFGITSSALVQAAQDRYIDD